MVLPSVLQAFESCVRRILALQADHVMPLNSISLHLMPGSVRVSARLASLDDAEASSMQSKLRASPSIRDRLATSIEGVNGIAAACTGPVSVTSFETTSEVQFATGSPRSLLACALIVALIGFSIVFVLGTGAAATLLLGNGILSSSESKSRRLLFYDLLTADESRTKQASHGHLTSDLHLEPEPEYDDIERDSGQAKTLGRKPMGRVGMRSTPARFQRVVARTGPTRQRSFSSLSSQGGDALESIPEGSEGTSTSPASSFASNGSGLARSRS